MALRPPVGYRALKTFPLAVTVALLFALAPPTLASHGAGDFTASGHITASNPTSDVVGGASQNGRGIFGDERLDGIDGDVIALPAWAPTHPVSVDGSSDLVYDLDIWFYDASYDFINGGDAPDGGTDCTTEKPDESCFVPAGAAYAVVDAWLGKDVSFTLTVSSTGGLPPPPPPETGVHTIPMFGPYTWDHGDLSVVIVPSTAAAAIDRSLEPLPEGTGVGPDSAYVQATKDAMTAWEMAMDAYTATHPSAAYLEAIEFDVKVLGVDATPADYDAADIRIMFSPAVPLGVGVLGVAIATQTNNGRFLQCDIVNADWFLVPYTSADMYNIHGQEFGHCLGLSHPQEPADDLMNGSYDHLPGNPATPRMCVSSLDVRGLAVAYDWMGTTGVWKRAPAEITEPRSDYARYDGVGTAAGCPN